MNRNLTLLFAAALVGYAGCGGSSTTTSSTQQGSGGTTSSSTHTTGSTTPASSSTGAGGGTGGGGASASSASGSGAATSTTGTGGEPADGGCTNGSSCTESGKDGLCKGGACAACTDVTDDAACAAAYGGQFICLAGACTAGNCHSDGDCVSPAGQICTGNVCTACASDTECQGDTHYGPTTLCAAGLCVTGNCHVDTDCKNPSGQICGLSAPNVCGLCTSDAQCQGDVGYGSAFICTTATGAGLNTGACVSSACTGSDETTCAANTGDVCCGKKCSAGNCCSVDGAAADTFCHTLLGSNNAACVSDVCSACDPITGNTYTVDPANGNDNTATGSGLSGGTAAPACAFKTIARALQIIGNNPGANTTIQVKSTGTIGTGTGTNGDTFPITVPTNVTITSASATAPATVTVPSGKSGFALTGASSGLLNLKVTGAAGSVSGVVAGAGTTATTTVQGVVVSGLGSDGIAVNSTGTLTFLGGTSSSGNGTTAAPASGLHVSGTGKALLTINSGTAVAFATNTAHGIFVEGSGSVTIGGTVSPAVTATANVSDNVFIEQTPGTPPLNSIANLAANGSTGGNGIHIFGGSSIKLRTSTTLGNAVSGVLVATYGAGGSTSDDVSKIDLGNKTSVSGSAGGNTLQAAIGATPPPNTGAGICLQLTSNANQTLKAEGNIFELLNCATSTMTITKSTTCTGGTNVGIPGGNIIFPNTNSVDIATCVLQ